MRHSVRMLSNACAHVACALCVGCRAAQTAKRKGTYKGGHPDPLSQVSPPCSNQKTYKPRRPPGAADAGRRCLGPPPFHQTLGATCTPPSTP